MTVSSQPAPPPVTPEVPAASERSSFITPEMIARNPALAAAGMFAGDPLFDIVVAEIKKERQRQRRRDSRRAAK